MNNSSIYFHSENIPFTLKQKILVKKWVIYIFDIEKKHLNSINIIFCNDDYLHQLNLTYLKHDTLTDVISFNYSENKVIKGDIYISIEQVKKNAKKFKTFFQNELHRVMVHGVLHLLDYNDETLEQQTVMTEKEDYYLSLLELFQIHKKNFGNKITF